MTNQHELTGSAARLYTSNQRLKQLLDTKHAEVEHFKACCDELRDMLDDAKSVRDQQSELLQLQNQALIELLSSIGGGTKSCGHEFHCICATNKARAAIAAYSVMGAITV